MHRVTQGILLLCLKHMMKPKSTFIVYSTCTRVEPGAIMLQPCLQAIWVTTIHVYRCVIVLISIRIICNITWVAAKWAQYQTHAGAIEQLLPADTYAALL